MFNSSLTRRTSLKGNQRLRPVAKRKPTRVYAIEDGVQTFPDGREACLPTTAGRREYKRRTKKMAERQGLRCAICVFPFDGYLGPATFEHQAGRTARQPGRAH